MNEIVEYYLKVVKNYAGFTGRARRKEFWMFAVGNIIICMAVMIVGGILAAIIHPAVMMVFSGILMLYSLAILIPSLAVTVRRLHDTNKSGWYYFVSLIPLIGGIWLLILLCTPGNEGDNQYGPDPKK